MSSPFVKYRDFFEPETTAEFLQLLNSNNIEFRTEEFDETLGSIYGSSPMGKVTTVKIMQDDFAKVDALLNTDAASLLETVDKDYHLFSFTNDELLEIVSKPDEWSAFDYQLAKNILKSRGADVGDEKLKQLKTERLQELAQPEPPQNQPIGIGYTLALLGGIVGVFIGWHLLTLKKVLPNGQRVYAYKNDDRKHGLRIMILGMIFSAVYISYSLYRYGFFNLPSF